MEWIMYFLGGLLGALLTGITWEVFCTWRIDKMLPGLQWHRQGRIDVVSIVLLTAVVFFICLTVSTTIKFATL